MGAVACAVHCRPPNQVVSSSYCLRQLVAGSPVLAGDVTTGSNSTYAALVVARNTETRAALLNVTSAVLTELIAQAADGEGAGSTLDDATLGAVALTIRALSIDPFEVSAGAASSAVASLTLLLKVRLSKRLGR